MLKNCGGKFGVALQQHRQLKTAAALSHGIKVETAPSRIDFSLTGLIKRFGLVCGAVPPLIPGNEMTLSVWASEEITVWGGQS